MRRIAIAACFVGFLAGTEPAQNDWKQQGVIYVDHSLNARIHPVPIQAVHLGEGFWAERRRVVTQRSLPTLLDLLEEHGVVDNFRRLSGKKNMPRRGPLYTDSDLYKWMEAAAWALASNETSEVDKTKLHAKLTSLIADVTAAQEPSGYLNTYFVGDKERLRFTDLTKSHEDYCLGHLLQAGIAYYRATGSRALLDPGIKFADYIVENFGPTRRPFITGHPELEMSLVELYRVTRDPKYLEFVRYLFSGVERDRMKLKDAEMKYTFSGRQFTSRTEFEGHAVRALYAASGATDYLMEGGEAAFRRTLDLLWNDLTMRKMYITGGVGARAGGESFGDPYELPNLEAYAETCAAIANVMWNFRMLAMTGEAQYADVLERALYNGVNSGMSLAGALYCYRNPLASNGSEKMRNPWYDTICCPPNLERLFESLPGYFYATSRDGIFVTLFHTSTLDWHLENGVGLNLAQSTNYPWSGDIRFTVQPSRPVEFTLNLRWPAWAPTADVTVNGQSVPASSGHPGSYISLNREWKPGDTVSLSLGMPITPMLANSHVLEDVGRVAFQRGPLVYALEQIDQGGALLADTSVRTNGALLAEPRRELLGGIMVLKVSGQTVEKSTTNGTDPLYAPLTGAPERAKRPLLLTFVPYYTVENREPNPMEVWVPVTRGEALSTSTTAATTGPGGQR
jgi:DUF1680 family protein